MSEIVDVEVLIGKNVINALATIVFDGAKNYARQSERIMLLLTVSGCVGK